MRPKHFLATAFLFACTIVQLQAQDTGSSRSPAESDKRDQHQMNFIKINLTSIALKNYSLQYERVLTRKFSLALAYRIMPSGRLPFANSISKAIGDDDPDAKKTIENLQMGNYAITPEARFYLGKGYGKGLYIAVFYRHANYTIDHLPVDYDNDHSLALSGKLAANTGGLMLGAQWPLGKYMCIDWWIFGPHYGAGTGNFTGVASQPLTPIEQDQLRQNLEDLDIPLTNKTINVNASGATMKLDGPWGGVRAGLSLGVKF